MQFRYQGQNYELHEEESVLALYIGVGVVRCNMQTWFVHSLAELHEHLSGGVDYYTVRRWPEPEVNSVVFALNIYINCTLYLVVL